MKICILMFYDNNISEYADINYKINKLYCDKYNLNLILSKDKTYTNRHSAYERLPLILKHIEKYDYVIWIDADAFFYIDSKNITDIIKTDLDTNINKNFIFSNDITNTNINTGFFIVKNTKYSIDFINKWAYDDDLYNNNPYKLWWDQGILNDMINKNTLNILDNIILYDYGTLQHFNNDELEKLPSKPFIYHLAGKRNEERLKASINYYKNINNDNLLDLNSIKLELIKLELILEYESKNSVKQKYLYDLETIINNSNTSLEGNCFYHHKTLNLYQNLYTKQLNLFWCGKQANLRICEIGFNAGHSTMLLLLGRNTTPLDFTIFDIGDHNYTKPCVEYIKNNFSHINFEYIEGDSIKTIPKWINNNKNLIWTYDVVHVDGGHMDECISNDMKNADLLVRNNGIIIIDDTNDPNINKYVDLYISSKNYIEIDILKTLGYPHRVIKKI